jgi:hypothetical protein
LLQAVEYRKAWFSWTWNSAALLVLLFVWLTVTTVFGTDVVMFV